MVATDHIAAAAGTDPSYSPGGSNMRPPSMAPWTHRSLLPNGILIASDVFAELMVMINIHPRQSVCSNGPHLCNACDAVQKDVKRSRVRVSDVALSGINLGQIVHTHTHVPLSRSSIVWLRPRGGDALRLGR